MALHYLLCMWIFHWVPVTVSVWGSNTGKAFMAKLAGSLFDLHRTAMFGKISEAKAEDLLNRLIFPVINDSKDQHQPHTHHN